MGEVVSIVYKPKRSRNRPDGYVRVPLEEANLVEGYGIEGDSKGGHKTRQLNIMAYERLAALAEAGYDTAPGRMGEQIIVKGVDVEALQPGDRIQLGDTVIEVTKPRTGCDKFEAVQGKTRAPVPQMGMMAKVVTGGTLRVGDPAAVLQPEMQGK
jgi:MOSC domain-containing protein YiiM